MYLVRQILKNTDTDIDWELQRELIDTYSRIRGEYTGYRIQDIRREPE